MFRRKRAAGPEAVTSPARAQVCRLSLSDRDTLLLAGVLTFATAAQALAEGDRILATARPTRLDLAAVTHADSAGLACVLALVAHARGAEQSLAVVNWPAGLRALAEVCDVASLLEPTATASA